MSSQKHQLVLYFQADGGGPLTFKQGGQHVLIGAVSHDPGCGENDGRYARISYLIDRQWIDREMSNSTFCGGTADASGRKKFRKRKNKNKKKKQRQRSKHRQ